MRLHTLAWQLYLPVRSEGEYERGNVRRNVKGDSALMDTDAADAIPQGRRQQRRGLVYDENFEGCSPASWPHTCFPPPHGGMGERTAIWPVPPVGDRNPTAVFPR